MTPGALITASAYAIIRGDLKEPPNHGFCLQLVRIIIEDAFSWPSHTFYRWRTTIVKRTPGASTAPWARDMEASLRAAGMDVRTPRTGPAGDPSRYVNLTEADLRAGDLLFRWDTALSGPDFVGHVGVFLGHGLVLENVRPAFRPEGLARDATVISRVGAWPVTTVVRFDPSVKPA